MDEGLGELCLARGGVIFPSLTLSASRKLDTFHKKCLEAFISHVKEGFDEFSLKIDEFFFNETELLKLPHYQIRQTIAQSTRFDWYISGKPKKKPQNIFHLRNI